MTGREAPIGTAFRVGRLRSHVVGSRTATALVGVAASLAISVAVWYYTGSLLLFLVVPFVPFLFGGSRREPDRPPARECPRCGFTTRNRGYDYCPRDGTRLEVTRPRDARGRG